MTYIFIKTPKDCDLLELGEDGLRFEKEHAYVGKFRMKRPEGPFDFELTASALEEIASETNRYIENGNKSNLPTRHTEDSEANRGHNLKWYVKEDSKGRTGLFSLTEFRDVEAAKLAKTAQTSIYCPPTWEDGQKNKYVRPVKHVALTDYPVIPGLDGFTPIAASLVTDKEIIMPIKDLAANIGLQLSDEVLADESKAFGAIQLAFEEVKAEAELQLSEYKKLNPPKADPIKVSKPQIAMLRENRELKLSQLVEKGNILPCVKKKLEDIFCGEAVLSLALSQDDHVDDFAKVVDALRDNDALKLSEVTGPQTQNVGLLLSEETNPVMAVARRAAARAAAR